jgi:predicted membrane channel-forming protein YqfA (hemolysin III family)
VTTQRTTVDVAISREGLATNVAGICMGAFTFMLLLVYRNAELGWASQLFFQAALTLVLASIFAFASSALYCDCLIVDMHAGDDRRAVIHYGRAEGFLTAGMLVLIATPTLILLALSLNVVALVGGGLWLAFVALAYHEQTTTRKGRKMIP